MRFATRNPAPIRNLVTGLLFTLFVLPASAAETGPKNGPKNGHDLLAPLPPLPLKRNLEWGDIQPAGKPANFARLRARLGPSDEIATLYALQIALSRLGDGQTYIWGRPKRKLRALFTPVSSYRNADGQICRQIIVSLSLGSYFKRIETAACRAADKSWQLL